MNTKFKLFTFALVMILACGAVAYIVADWSSQPPEWEHDQQHGHEWLRQEIGLTDAESVAIDAFEAEYRQQRAALLEQYKIEMLNLRDLLVQQDSFSPQIQHAIHELHLVHGELQELSIRHYYDMLNVLPPEKKDRLRKLAADALSEPE